MKFIPTLLQVDKFRKLNNQTIKLGKEITVFSGQNGVGKSNLLSLIATLFGTKDRRATGGNFYPEFSDYFTISPDEDIKSYQCYLSIEAGSKGVIQKRHGFSDYSDEGRGVRILPRATNRFTQEKTQKEIEQVTKKLFGLSATQKVPMPTIFLSLARLYPMGEVEIRSSSIRANNKSFTNEIQQQYTQWYNQVLNNSITNTAPSASLIKKNIGKQKQNLHIELDETYPETQSIGQDNLSSIISALIDFFILKQELGEDYYGGILCIDEIDASLHPSAQLNLFRLLKATSQTLNLQLFLSTHSLTVIKEILKLQKRNPENYRLNYIIDPQLPRLSKINSYEELKSDLFDRSNYYQPELKVYCEDDMTAFVLSELLLAYKRITGKIELPLYQIIPVHLGCTNLVKLPTYDEHFKKVVIVLDGDAKTDAKGLLNKYLNNESLEGIKNKVLPDNCICLPSFLAPESYLYHVINKLILDDNFWYQLDDIPEARLYTKNKLISETQGKLPNHTDVKNDNLKNKEISAYMKDFFKSSQALTYFYSIESNKGELLSLIKECEKTFQMVQSKMKASI